MKNPRSDFDVIVVGAGPAGANCARELAKFGHKVLLIEKSQKIGEPNFSSAGMPAYVLDEFSLPKSVVGDFWDKLQLVTLHNEFTWEFGGRQGYVLKFNELKKFLVNDAISAGCKIMIQTSVTKPIIKNGTAIGVEFAGLERGELKAKVIVDASGAQGVVASKIGLRSQIPCPPTVGLEYIFSGVKFPQKNTLIFYLSQTIAPHGYNWIFPMGNGQVKVGIGAYNMNKFIKVSLINLLKKFIAHVPWLSDAQPLELHGSTLFINGGIGNFVKNNVVVIGDAGLQINPLGAEGVRHALRSSRLAAERIHEALTKEDDSILKKYEDDWKSYVGRKWEISNFLAQVVYHKFTDEMYDKALSVIKNLKAEDMYDLLFEYRFEKAIKLAKPSLSFLKLSQKLFGTNIWNLLGRN